MKSLSSLLDHLSVTGFSVICAWRFLVLFSPVFSDTAQGRPFAFQAALYLSIAATYALLVCFCGRLTKLLHRNGQTSWRRCNVALGCLACAATVLVVLAHGTSFPVELCSWVAAGAAEALLMFPWLQMLGQRAGKMGNPMNFVFNMGLGGCIAFIIGNLTHPYNLIALCALPLLANISLAASRDAARPRESEDAEKPAGGGKPSPAAVLTENGKLLFYGISFGICQYVLSAASGAGDVVFFAIGSSWPVCGVALSAFAIILAIGSKRTSASNVHSIQHFSALLFMTGLMLSFYAIASHEQLDRVLFTLENLSGQMLCFAGLTTFDFGFMILVFSHAVHLGGRTDSFITLNRALLYLALGAGLLIGRGLDAALSSSIPNYALAVVGGITVLFTASTMPVFDRLPSFRDSAANPEADAGAPVQKPRPQSNTVDEDGGTGCLERIADECGLSKREREIFGYLADGMTAAEIQQKLWISIHTVKTHISNVYHKLGVHSAQELLAYVDAGRGQNARGGQARKGSAHEGEDAESTGAHRKKTDPPAKRG